jgi:DNA-binding NtrC family response regulator
MLSPPILPPTPPQAPADRGAALGGATIDEDGDGSFLDDQEKTSGHVPIRDELEALERKRILDALAQCAGNQTKAAKMLGMSRRTLLNRLDSYAIARPRKAKE